jgi:hypothetical protein
MADIQKVLELLRTTEHELSKPRSEVNLNVVQHDIHEAITELEHHPVYHGPVLAFTRGTDHLVP